MDPCGEEEEDEANRAAESSEMEQTGTWGYPSEADRAERASIESVKDSVPDELLLRRILGRMVRELAVPGPGVGGTSFDALPAAGWVTNVNNDGRDTALGRIGSDMANAGVRGVSGVMGVFLVASDKTEVGVSEADAPGGLLLGMLSVRGKRFGLARFMLSTEGKVDGGDI